MIRTRNLPTILALAAIFYWKGTAPVQSKFCKLGDAVIHLFWEKLKKTENSRNKNRYDRHVGFMNTLSIKSYVFDRLPYYTPRYPEKNMCNL